VPAQPVLKWGNSLAFRIPSAIAKQLNITEGASVAFRIEGRRLILERAEDIPEFSAAQLSKALAKSKRKLVDYGRPRGDELL